MGRTEHDVCTVVQQILNGRDPVTKTLFKNNKPGRGWFRRFCVRWNIEKRKAGVLDKPRAQVTHQQITTWFEEVKKNIKDKFDVDVDKLDPSHIFNCDESGFQMKGHNHFVFTEKSAKRPYIVDREKADNITVICCAGADGIFYHPTIIYPGQRMTLNPKPDEEFPAAYITMTKSGWVQTDVFLDWFRRFAEYKVDRFGKDEWVVLFVDGHSSHLSFDVHLISEENKIIFQLIPPHASHIVQPLGRCWFGHMKREWCEASHTSTVT